MTPSAGSAPLCSLPPPASTRPAEDLAGRVWEALRTVRDPELDADVVSLDFVASVSVDPGPGGTGPVGRVRLRLPTYFCAPNFAFLMVADAWDAVSTVSGVAAVDIALLDHFASEAINSGVAARAGFVGAMKGLPGGSAAVGEAVAELDELRRTFTERALMAGTDLVVRPLMRDGATPEQIATTTLGDVPASADLERLRARRRELGLPAADTDPLVIDPTGATVGVDALPMHLRRARSYQVGVDANTSICRGQLAARYGV